MKQIFGSPSLLGLISIAVFGLVLAGCGGGGTGGSTTQKSSLPSFNNGKVAPVTAAQVAAAQTSVDKVWANGMSGSQTAAANAILAQMSKLPVFRAGAVTPDGGIWGQYTNGTEVLYFTNDPNWSDYMGAPARSRPKPSTHAKPTAGGEISGSAKAYVIETMEAARNPVGPQIASELTAAGYNVTSLVGHLSDWAAVSGSGVMYASSHGIYVPNSGQFYQETADLESAALNSQYATQLAKNTIISGQVIVNDTIDTAHPGHRVEGVDYHFESRYCFGANFLTNPTMFAKDSFMVDDACSGMEDGGNFADYLQNQLGLSVFAAWTTTVDGDDSTQSSLFVFDRLLGLDKAAPVDPTDPPPGTWSDVLSVMQTTTRPNRPFNFVTSFVAENGITQTSEFSFRASSSNKLQTIIPSVATAQLDSSGKTVTISGYFGSTQGTVKFNGSYMTVNSWSSGSIVVNAPSESEGEIIVEGAVTGGKGYLDSNSYDYSNITLSPHNPTLALGAKQTFTATGQIPANSKFEWTLDGNGSIGSGASVTTTAPTIAYTAPNSFTTDDLTLKVVNASGEEVGSASDTISVTSTLVLGPSNPELLPQQQQLITVSAAKGSLPAGAQFKWTLSGAGGYGVLGSIGGSTTVTTTLPSITYTAADGLGKDTLQVQLIGSSGDVEGTTSTTLTTAIQLVITPTSASLATGGIQTFVASAAKGHIPPYPAYGILWALTGHGSVSSSTDTLTLKYTAPGTPGDSTLVATLQGPRSRDYASVTIPIVVGLKVGITPTTPTLIAGQTQTFTVAATAGEVPEGSTYKWALSGNGSIGASNPATTANPTIAYTAGSSGPDTLSVQVLGPNGTSLAQASTSIAVSSGSYVNFTVSGSSQYLNPNFPADQYTTTGGPATDGANGSLNDVVTVSDYCYANSQYANISFYLPVGGVIGNGQVFTPYNYNGTVVNWTLGQNLATGPYVTGNPSPPTGSATITSAKQISTSTWAYAFKFNLSVQGGGTVVGNGGFVLTYPKGTRAPGKPLK